MYDLSGLKHLIYYSDLPLFFLALLLLVLYRKAILNSFKKKCWEKGVKTVLLLVTVGILWSVLSSGIIAWHIYKPDISCYEGKYLKEYPANEARLSFFSWRYVFDNGAKPHEAFYLDSFSKKNIYNKDFEKGKRYRIYYEEKDNIIVKVEELD